MRLKGGAILKIDKSKIQLAKLKTQTTVRTSDIADGVEGISANVLHSQSTQRVKLKLNNQPKPGEDTKTIEKYEERIKELENTRSKENQQSITKSI